MKTRNDGTECIEKQSAHSIPPPHTHRIDLLAHRQSEWLFSWNTTNQRIQWLRWPTANLLRLRMLNNVQQCFVPDLLRVSPNASDVQQLGQCVPAFSGAVLTV